MKFTVGIIGNGRFGNLLFDIFSKSEIFHTKLFSRKAELDGIEFFSLEDVCKSDIVIPCVPISKFEETINLVKDKLVSGCLVVDVCSINLMPEKAMKKMLDKKIDLLSTHPMFGPDSTKNGTFFENLNFIFHPTRINDAEKCNAFLKLWKNLGCNMVPMTPEEHDRQAAFTHAFAFLVGKVGMNMNVRKNTISTKGFDCLMYNQQAIENDSSLLFQDMMLFNPFAKEMLSQFEKALENIRVDLEIN